MFFRNHINLHAWRVRLHGRTPHLVQFPPFANLNDGISNIMGGVALVQGMRYLRAISPSHTNLKATK